MRIADNVENQPAILLYKQVNIEIDLRTAPLNRWTLVRLTDSYWQLLVTESIIWFA